MDKSPEVNDSINNKFKIKKRNYNEMIKESNKLTMEK